jgi:hypothetical protein
MPEVSPPIFIALSTTLGTKFRHISGSRHQTLPDARSGCNSRVYCELPAFRMTPRWDIDSLSKYVSQSEGNQMKKTNNGKTGSGRPRGRVGKRTLPARSHAARDRALHALADVRHGSSPSQAARDNGVTLRTMKKHVGAALVQDRPGGRIRATKTDRLVRYLQISSERGPIEIQVRGSKQASDAARFNAAVNRYLRGDLDALVPWHGKKIGGVDLITAGSSIKSLAQKELLPLSLYRALSGGGA